MTWEKLTFGPDAVIDFLNNAKELGPFPMAGLPLGGKTLVFSEPAATVTFPGDDGANMPLLEVMETLRREVPGLRASMRPLQLGQKPTGQRSFSIYRDAGIRVAKDGTANELFGLSRDDETAIKPPIPNDSVKSMSRASPSEYEVVLAGADADRESPAATEPKNSSNS